MPWTFWEAAVQLEKDDTGQAGPAMPEEAAAELRALQLVASQDPNDQPEPPDPSAPAPVMPPPLGEELAAMLSMVSKMVAPALPSVAAIYTDEACGAVGMAVAGVCDKYGWLQGGVGGEYGPEIMCLIVVGPIAFATYGAVQKDVAAIQATKRPSGDRTIKVTEPPAGAQRPPGADTVTVGAPIA